MNQFKADINILTTADSGPRATSIIRLGVFHTTENDDLTPPDNVAKWQLNRANGSSYNLLFGADGRTVRGNDDNYIPWSAGQTGNRFGVHGSAVGRASRSRADWLKFPRQLESMARWAADLNQRYNIPLKWLTASEVRAGARGFCGHAEISNAWKEVNHTDPGRGFPHDLILTRAAEIARGEIAHTPPDVVKDNDMPDDNRTDLILDQHLGHPWREMNGWTQLGGRSIVDALAAIGEHLGIDGMKDTKK